MGEYYFKLQVTNTISVCWVVVDNFFIKFCVEMWGKVDYFYNFTVLEFM